MKNPTLMICKALGIPANTAIAVDIALRFNKPSHVRVTSIVSDIDGDGVRIFNEVEQLFELTPKATAAQGDGGQQPVAGG